MNTMLKKRYLKRNANALWQNFLRKDYKKSFLESKSLRFALLLVVRKAITSLTLSDSYRAKVIKSYARAQYRKRIQKQRAYHLLPVFVAHRAWLWFVKSQPVGAMLLRPYVFLRYKLGKIDIPYFELVLTTRCSLRCESCNNLMQYFDSKNAYTCSLEKILETLEALCRVVDSVAYVRIIGGEPLLFKDIAKVAQALEREQKVKMFDIVTNGTIMPDSALLEVLARSQKSWVSISDYSTSPNLKVKLKINEISRVLTERRIAHHILWQSEGSSWFDPGKIYKRGRDKEGIIKNFKACMMACVSVMSNESFALKPYPGGGQLHSLEDSDLSASAKNAEPKSQNTESSKMPNRVSSAPSDTLDSKHTDIMDTATAARTAETARTHAAFGHIFICPIASSLSRLKGLEEFEGDFITLDSHTSKADFRRFYTQEYFKACDYCHDMWGAKRDIPIAVQTKEVLALSK
ncbi:radical SAM protein [uncultured Helicobacter sp.]|uniref:radical SAM protein n=1 Tax=uncultured Helicobacter sp. TaxID=175537 RepID=UPI003753980B